MSSKEILIFMGPLCVLVLAVTAFTLLRILAEANEPIQAVPLAARTMNEQTTATESTEENVPVVSTETIRLFEINSDVSQVQFAINEILLGSPFTAVGVTNQVAGQIALDPTDLSTVQLGIIQVNARTLVTDDDFRNQALNNQILDTDQYEYIIFTPTVLDGLPDSVSENETVNFTIIGDLTIRDVTQQVAFDASVTLVSESELQGTAEATILRSDYGLTIPNVRQVAEVSDELLLSIDFVATAV